MLAANGFGSCCSICEASGEVTCLGKRPAARWRNETGKGMNSK